MRLRFVTFLVFVSLVHPSAAEEQSAAVLIPGVQEIAWNTDGPFTFAFRFRVNQPILVTAVGAFDHQSNGLAVSHEVAIWSAEGSTLISAIVPAGTSTQLIDRFRYIPISPMLLPAGGQYLIAGANFGRTADHYLATQPVAQVSPRITLFETQWAYTPTGALTFPTRIEHFSTPGWFGPNFRFTTPPVPEPSSLLLLALGSALALATRRC